MAILVTIREFGVSIVLGHDVLRTAPKSSIIPLIQPTINMATHESPQPSRSPRKRTASSQPDASIPSPSKKSNGKTWEWNKMLVKCLPHHPPIVAGQKMHERHVWSWLEKKLNIPGGALHTQRNFKSRLRRWNLVMQVLHLIPRPFFQICRLTHLTARPTLGCPDPNVITEWESQQEYDPDGLGEGEDQDINSLSSGAKSK